MNYKELRVIFFGTPEYVLPILKALKRNYDLVVVVTQEPKPAGRARALTRSDVDNYLFKKYQKKVPVLFNFEKLPEADMGVVASYGNIIPKSVIDHFSYGILNIHPSLLPKFRGASPIQSTIAGGEIETGVSVMLMDEKMDHGPIVSSFKDSVGPDDTTASLRERLFDKSTQFLVDLIPSYLDKKIKPKPQNHGEATFTKLIDKSDGEMKLEDLKSALEGKDAREVYNKIRAMDPWPGAWTVVDTGRLKILRARIESEKLVLDEVQLEGKNPVSWEQFKQGYPDLMF